MEQVGASDSKLESLAAADVASKPEEKQDKEEKPAMSDADLFRLRMRLISKGYSSQDADKTVAVSKP